ncbi:hypothetical protein [Curtobacterium poinsettiae]|uniref:Secreted protein n=1 Tax=Curtobacterium poinsettiae TaxID=159612 RepID=A0A9Q9P715_9MICO|nr:hypothetical protein [Curtobacterium flaccumfaciens]UYC80420.1 hypothetical protein OE229_15065 [Curtobacterium flaccumfaciens pv. poinsettiae]
MDHPLRAPWRAALRIVLLGVGTLAALVLLSLLLGARPASAATTSAAPSEQRGLVGSVVDGVGGTVQGATDEVGKVLGGVTDPSARPSRRRPHRHLLRPLRRPHLLRRPQRSHRHRQPPLRLPQPPRRRAPLRPRPHRLSNRPRPPRRPTRPRARCDRSSTR